MLEQSDQPRDDGALRTILKNVGWLLGGKGFGAVSSLLYLAILSRSLGVKDFGHFSLIFGITQAMVALAGFQTWQMIVRFGAPHLAQGRTEAFGRLAILGGVVDATGATIGCIVTVAAFYFLSDTFEVNQAYEGVAIAFTCAMLWARVSAPYGIIRGLDRFELSVFVGAITPAGRLIAAIVIWLTGPSVTRFLVAWALVEFITSAAMWFTAIRLRRDVMRLSRLKEWRRTFEENEGLVNFLGVTYANTSLNAAIQQGPLLAVGMLFGTSAAGVYRIADQLAKGLSKFAALLSDAVYPEVNKQLHSQPADHFRKLIRQVSVSVIIMGAIAVGVAVAFGEAILTLIAGPAFAAGALILIPLVLAASFEPASVSYDSVFHSVGKAHYQFFVRLGVLAVLSFAIFVFPAHSGLEVGWSLAAAQAIDYIATTLLISLVLRQLIRDRGNG